MKPRVSEAHEVDDDEACQRVWDNRLDVRPIIDRELKRTSEKKRITGFQARMICGYGNIHPRTLARWAQGRSRSKQSARIEDAISHLGWTHLLDVPFEDPDAAPDLGE
jgi:hypothetical protein